MSRPLVVLTDDTIHPAATEMLARTCEVAVLNGTAVEGLAGSFGDMVESRGFQLGNVTNTDSAQELSAVMFKPNNGRAAQKVATALDIPRVQPMTEEVARLGEGAPVAVVVGEDSASTAG